ncbi:hypothetical protein AOL_s00080g321 [Orbilia oligospora ATCC 24927]|uniref:Uncharacterized protein n=1 Tax=Arthrobotrys oligospora (strain ATCC 24927 / CBS 115.81 / DSM 1491) TaxID=756982 RepID=G1XET6_ARTOA|nr:hypothetical protein AOL_s00080g321 [Orbilia oligospora ATCC 24927]EGX48351.1 hypothetical protein AOL_s00080g321 [Orbilia oligospora ATCC 24927]
MRVGAALAILFGLAATPSLAADPIDWDNIVFEWVTVTVTASTCHPHTTTLLSAFIPTAESQNTSTPTAPTVLASSVTQIPYNAPAQILGQPIVQEIVTSVPHPTIQTTWESTVTYESSQSTVPVATATLRPAVVSDANLANPQNLRPKVEHDLYYAGDSNSNANDATMPIANVKLNFTMAAVNLESSKIESVTCSPNPSGSGTIMKIVFNDKEAYHVAMTTWPKNDDFLLIGYFLGCGAYSSGERSFSKVHQVVSNGVLTITATVEDLSITEAITEGEIKFGSFNSGIASRSETNTTAPYYGVGVPNECLGDKTNDFDVELDNKLGVTKDLPSFVSRFNAKRAMRRRREASRFSRIRSDDVPSHIERRWSIGGFFEDIGKAIVDVAEKVVDTVKDIAETAWDGISSAMQKIGKEIIDAGKTIIGTVADFDYIDTTASWDTFLSKKTKFPKSEKIGSKWNTPWGLPGHLLGADTETDSRIFCVNCGVKGDIKLNGHLTFSLKDGLKAATFTMNGTMSSNLQFGFWAQAKLEVSTSTELFDIPLGPITVPGLFDIGPQIVVMAEASASIATAGMMTAGFSMNWNPYMKVDMIDWTTETKGWEPTLHPMIQLDGEIVATVGIEMPIMLGFGVNLLKGWVLEQVVVSETPGVSLSARYAGQVRVNDKEKWAGIDGAIDTDDGFTCPNKIALFLDFTNSIDFAVTDVMKKNLGKATVPLYRQCLGGNPSSSSTSTSTSTTATESTAESATSATSTETSTTSIETPNPYPTPILEKRQEQSFTTLTTMTTFTTTEDNPSGTTTYTTSSIVTSIVPVVTASTSTLSELDGTTVTFTEASPTTSQGSGIDSSDLTVFPNHSNTTTTKSKETSTSSSSNKVSLQTTRSTASYGTGTLVTVVSQASSTLVSSSVITTTSTFSTTRLVSNGTTSSGPAEGTTASPVTSTATFTSVPSIQNTTSVYSRGNSTATTFSSTTTSTLTSASTAPTSALNFPKVTIKDAADGLFLNTNADGTLFLCNGNCGSPAEFYTRSSVVVGDTHDRVIHIYSRELETYGVSRLRLHNLDKLPNTSVIVGLYEFQPTKVVVVSSAHPDVFFLPVACRIEGQQTKMFVVKELESGIETLKRLGSSIAGGKVLECSVKNLDLVTV